MSRDELASRVNGWLHAQTGKAFALDERAVGRWERGTVQQPSAHYRAALRAVLAVDHDWELGFAEKPSAHVGAAEPVAEPPTVAAIRLMAGSFQTVDRRLGGGQLYATVLAYLHTEVARALFTAREGSQVFAAAAAMTEITGWMAHDGGHDGAARNHFATNMCASMSHLAGQLGQVDDAIRMAGIGLDRALDTGGVARVTARLHAMRAKALATRGDRDACLRDLAAAEHALGGDDDHEHAAWSAYFDEASLAAEIACTLHLLGDLAAAERWAREVIALRGGDRVRSLAFGRLSLATIVADAGRPDEAASLGAQVCTVVGDLASSRVRHGLDLLVTQLGAHPPTPRIGALDEQVRQLHSAATSQGGAAWPI